jgi:hypothetical protein
VQQRMHVAVTMRLCLDGKRILAVGGDVRIVV